MRRARARSRSTSRAPNQPPVGRRPERHGRRGPPAAGHADRIRSRGRSDHVLDRDASPAHGTLSGTAPTLTYTPAQDYFGPDALHVHDPRRVLELGAGDRDHHRHRGQRPAGLGIGLLHPRRCGHASAAATGAAVRHAVRRHLRRPAPAHLRQGCLRRAGGRRGHRRQVDDRRLRGAGPLRRGARIARSSRSPSRSACASPGTACRCTARSPEWTRASTARRSRVPATPQALPGGGTIGTYGLDGNVIVVWPDGSVAIVHAVGIYPEYYRFTVELGLAPARLGHMVGLLGNADGIVDQRPRHPRRPTGDVPEHAVRRALRHVHQQLADQPGRVAVRLRRGSDDRDLHRSDLPRRSRRRRRPCPRRRARAPRLSAASSD